MKAHGYADIFWNEDILTLEVHGPFNEEGVKLVNKEVKEAVINKKIKHWRRIENLDNETMGSDLTVSFVKELYLWAEENGCRACAVVVSNLIQKQAISGLMKGRNAKIFHHLEDAKKWIDQQ